MRGLGELEAAVMNVLWDTAEPIRVRGVLERLDTGRKLAYTTVMTVLENLHRKQWVKRELHGKAYEYEAAFSRVRRLGVRRGDRHPAERAAQEAGPASMTAALALFAGAVVVGWLLPHVLRRMNQPRRDPVQLIAAWLVSTACVLLATATAVLMLLLPDHGPGPSLLAAVHSCWSRSRRGWLSSPYAASGVEPANARRTHGAAPGRAVGHRPVGCPVAGT
jgi:hypothetical protein